MPAPEPDAPGAVGRRPRARRRGSSVLSPPVAAWALWDWGSSAFTAVITTFVFTVYLTSTPFGSADDTSSTLGVGLSLAGIVVAVLAPVLGQSADRAGRQGLWLGVNSAIVVLISALLYLVRPEPAYLLLGVGLVAVGNVFVEFANVNYYAMLARISTPETIGRISGFGWGFGYFGGIALLLAIVTGFVRPEVGWFGVTHDDGMHVRVAMLFAAAWFAVFAAPVLFLVRDTRRSPVVEPDREASFHEASVQPASPLTASAHDDAGRAGSARPGPGDPDPTKLDPIDQDPADTASVVVAAPGGASTHRGSTLHTDSDASPATGRGPVAAYRRLGHTLRTLWRDDRRTLRFLIAAAVYRDGLAGVFTFGGVIAAGSFGFSAGSVITFGIAANLVAGIATIASGVLDDRLGPKRVIVASLGSMIVAGIGLFVLHGTGPAAFWVLGLVLCVFVGPAQAASRSCLARMTPAHRQGEVFGLYATAGRAATFAAPALFSASIWLGGRLAPGAPVQHWGILGLMAVLLAGLGLVLPVPLPGPHRRLDAVGRAEGVV